MAEQKLPKLTTRVRIPFARSRGSRRSCRCAVPPPCSSPPPQCRPWPAARPTPSIRPRGASLAELGLRRARRALSRRQAPPGSVLRHRPGRPPLRRPGGRHVGGGRARGTAFMRADAGRARTDRPRAGSAATTRSTRPCSTTRCAMRSGPTRRCRSWAWDPQIYNEAAGTALYSLAARDFAPWDDAPAGRDRADGGDARPARPGARQPGPGAGARDLRDHGGEAECRHRLDRRGDAGAAPKRARAAGRAASTPRSPR